MRFIDPNTDEIRKLAVELYGKETFELLTAWKLQLETTLIVDALMMFGEALSGLPKNFSTPVVDCTTDETWMYGTTLTNLIKGMKYPGFTGLIQFDTKGFRSAFALEIYELKEGGTTRVANWSYSEGLNLSRFYPPEPPTTEGSLVNKTFMVITCLVILYV